MQVNRLQSLQRERPNIGIMSEEIMEEIGLVLGGG
jgi:hypothetical protein